MAPALRDRLWELVDLCGGEGLSYTQAARRMGISVRTVQEYAAEIRALAGIPATPQRALFILYRDHRMNGGAEKYG